MKKEIKLVRIILKHFAYISRGVFVLDASKDESPMIHALPDGMACGTAYVVNKRIITDYDYGYKKIEDFGVFSPEEIKFIRDNFGNKLFH